MENNYYARGNNLVNEGQYKEAFKIFEEGFLNGDPKCAFGLARMYNEGLFVEKDEQKAINLYAEYFDKVLALAKQSDVAAQRLIANRYKNGQGVERSYEKAVYWYTKAAEQGDAEAQNNLGFCYEKGQGIEQSFEKAAYWYKKAAEQGYDKAQCNLGNFYYNGKGVAQDYEKAVYWFAKSAEHGYSKAQYNLALCYEKGDGVEQSNENAVYWYIKSAEQGLMEAQYNLALCYDNGKGVEQDYEKSVYWYTQAAEQGDAEAQFNLARCYEKGDGIEQSNKKAVYWYTQAAEQGLPEAQYNLGNCYYFGNGAEQNYEQAMYWYSKAAENSISMAQFNLARCYDNGEGVEQSNEKAVYWYIKSAEQGLPEAQHNLALCYYNGEGIEKNNEKAVYWYTKAAEQGLPEAQCNLGDCYYFGNGVVQSYEKAVELYTKSAENGYIRGKFFLGACYEEGLGVKADCKKAISLYEEVTKADKQKLQRDNNLIGEAFYFIALIYINGGKGVEKDKFKARKFFEYAKENNYGCDSEIDAIDSELNIGLTETNKMGKFSREIIEKDLPINELFPTISAKLKEEFGGTWDMIQQSSRECLVTGCLAYMALFSTGPDNYKHMDFSAAIVPMTKACEIEFGRIFFNKFLAYLKENNIPPTEFNPTTQRFVRLNTEKSSKMERYGEDKTYLYFRQKKGKGKETVYYVDEKFTGVYTLGGFLMYANIEKRRVVETANITLNIGEMIDRDGKPLKRDSAADRAQLQKLQNEQKEEYEICVDKHMLAFADKIFTEEAFPNPGRKDKIKKYLYNFANSTFNMAKWLRNPAAHSEIMEYWRAVYCGNMVIMIDKILQNFLSKIKPEYLK